VTCANQVNVEVARELMTAAWDRGATFFDNTEGYVLGESERVVGKDLKELGWARAQYVVSAWIFWGGQIPNEKGLSFKHIAEGVNRSLRNFQTKVFYGKDSNN